MSTPFISALVLGVLGVLTLVIIVRGLWLNHQDRDLDRRIAQKYRR